MTARHDYWAENMARAIRDWENVLRGHDAVHPDRDVCGGVGGCALMNLEYDSREKVVDLLEAQVRGTGFEVRRKEPFEPRLQHEVTINVQNMPAATAGPGCPVCYSGLACRDHNTKE